MVNGKPVMKSCRVERELRFQRNQFRESLHMQLMTQIQVMLSSKHDPDFTKEDLMAVANKGETIRQILLRIRTFRARFPYRTFHSRYGHMAKAYRAQERVLAKHRGVDVMDNKIFKVE